MLKIPMHQISSQKYRRTNFEEDDNSTADGLSPATVSFDPAVSFQTRTMFFRRRSLLERILIVLVFLLLFTVLILALLLKSHSSGSKNIPAPTVKTPEAADQQVCLSKTCVTVSSSILNSMDETVDPCDDFYQFACGGWLKSHPIPAGESRWDTFGVLRKANQIVLKNVLESPYNESRSESEMKAKRYYLSCIDNNKTLETLGAAPLLKLLQEFGGWSVSNSSGMWNVSKFNFQDTLQKIHALGMSNFFNIWVGEDEKDPTKNILQFDQSGIVLAREQYINKTTKDDKILGAYLKYMTGVSFLLGGSDWKIGRREWNRTENLMQKVIDFEQRIAEITTSQEDRRDDEKMYNKMTVKDLQAIAQFINWKDYINSLLQVASITINDSEPILFYEPGYIKQMSTLFLDTIKTDEGKMTVHNYMMWHLVKMMSSYLSKQFQDVRKEFVRVLSGITGDEEQWRYCTSDTDGVLGFAVGAMFVRDKFHGESKLSAEDMIASIKKAFVNNLPNLNWMDDSTRRAAVEKAEAVVDMIGFPEYILNSTKLDAKYQELEINEDEYFLNNYRSFKYSTKRNFEKLRKQPEKLSWSMTPSTVNAYYTPTKNEIVFPAGILQAPFYNKDFPKSLNYGAMGVVMGHELTHGFDDQGREYDKSGTLRLWWNESSINSFVERTKCMIDQYSKYSAFGENLKGKQTLGENIADNGGLKSAFNAYEDLVRLSGEEPALPGLKYTHRQLFFLAFAQVWCTNSRAEDNHMSILTDPHSLPRYRVIGPISNSREFAEQFSCPKNSLMNPTTKCEVW